MITGKDVYEAGRPYLEKQGFEGTSWEECDFGQGTQAFYNEIAQKVNESHIKPLLQQIEQLKADFQRLKILDRQIADDQDHEIAALKGLVRDYRSLLEDDELVIEDNSDGWWERRRAALTLAKQLTGEEK